MKHAITLLLLIVGTSANAQQLRDAILGNYSGLYWRYGGQPEMLPSEVMLLADPSHNDRCILIDTLNDIADTVVVSCPENLDTLLSNTHGFCGDFFPQADSIIFIYFPLEGNGLPDGQFHISRVGGAITALSDQATQPIVVYPNPATDKLFFSAKNIKTYTIYTTHGQLVEEGTIDAPTTACVYINHLQPGLYYIKLAGYSNTVTRTIIKQ
jgi:hypothetical protein